MKRFNKSSLSTMPCPPHSAFLLLVDFSRADKAWFLKGAVKAFYFMSHYFPQIEEKIVCSLICSNNSFSGQC